MSQDGGKTWRVLLPINGEVNTIDAVISAKGHLFISSASMGVYRSTDNGLTWQEYNTGLSSWGKNVVQFLSKGDTLFIGTSQGVYYTGINSNNGWIEYNENLPSSYAWTVNAMCYSGNNLILSSGGSGYYYLRPEGSPGWIEKTITGTDRGITPFTFLSVGDTVFAGAGKSIYRSIDNGWSWDSVGIRALPVEVSGFAKHLNRVYVSFYRENEFFIWYTDDGGNTWNSGFHEYAQLNKIYIDNNILWAATFFSGLWYHNFETTSAPVDGKDFDFILQQNYPNPFNPVTNIEFQVAPSNLTEGEALVSLKIYNILGNEVAALINEIKPAGNYKIQFDASGLSSGVYFYKLTAGNFTKTKKMVLLQ